MKVAHSNFAKVTRVVLVEIRSVMMLATSHTSSTGVLAMLSNTAVAGGDITTAIGKLLAWMDFEGMRLGS